MGEGMQAQTTSLSPTLIVVGSFIGLLVGDNIDGFTSRSPLLGLMPVSRSLFGCKRRQRRLGEIRLTVERRINRRADERRTGEGGENRPAKPADRDAPPVERTALMAADLDRGLQPEISDRLRKIQAVMGGQRVHTPDKFPS